MSTRKQTERAKENILKTQEEWVSPKRAQPGSGGGQFYRIVVRPKSEFVTFRIQDVGKKGRIERLAGKRSRGTWDTQAWLISKHDAHLDGNNLIADTRDAEEVLKHLASKPRLIRADIFEAKDRKNITEKNKPTEAQKNASRLNIKKAQKARMRYSM